MTDENNKNFPVTDEWIDGRSLISALDASKIVSGTISRRITDGVAPVWGGAIVALPSEKVPSVPTEAPKDTGSRDYYKDVIPGYEYFQLMETLLGHEGFVGHCKGQIFKYCFGRFGKKDDIALEAVKVKWYSAYLADYLDRHKKGLAPYKPTLEQLKKFGFA